MEVSLLVVSHCHADHIGCLPRLVEQKRLKAQWALVADEARRWGDAATMDALAAAPDNVRRAVGALLEEDYSSASDDEISAFLDRTGDTQRQEYVGMLKALQDGGCQVVRYGKDDHSALLAAFAGIGLEILGPTVEQLEVCQEAAAKRTQHALAEVSTQFAAAPAQTDVELYRALMGGPASFYRSQPNKGTPNDTSIVLKLGSGDEKVLLAGDMQFAEPELEGIGNLMTELLTTVGDSGPYALIKTTHHTSYNGLNGTVLAGWADTRFFAHCGGLDRKDNHPNDDVLSLLRQHAHELALARTDLNGVVQWPVGGSFRVARGQLNDFSAHGQ